MVVEKVEKDFEKAAIDFVERVSLWDDTAVLLCDTARLREQARGIMRRRPASDARHNTERACTSGRNPERA